MKGLNPCPYCRGEVEIVKLNRKHKSDKPMYRIECLQCRKLVEKGTGFPGEPWIVSKERIDQFEELQKDKYARVFR